MLNDTIVADMTKAMKSQDKFTLGVLRMLKSALQLERINKKADLTDEDVISVIKKQVKQRKDSILEYEKYGKDEEVTKLQAEIKILSTYLPEEMSAEEVDKIINEVFSSMEVTSLKDMSKIINEVKSKTGGRADMASVSKKVKEIIMKNL